MEIIEIRQNKKTLIPTLAVLTIVLLAGIYYNYFSDASNTTVLVKVIHAFFSVLFLYAIYVPTKKFIKDEPVLIFSTFAIEVNEKGVPVTFLWSQIIDAQVAEDDGTRYLILETADTHKKLNISWLEKNPSEIKELLEVYRKKS